MTVIKTGCTHLGLPELGAGDRHRRHHRGRGRYRPLPTALIGVHSRPRLGRLRVLTLNLPSARDTRADRRAAVETRRIFARDSPPSLRAARRFRARRSWRAWRRGCSGSACRHGAEHRRAEQHGLRLARQGDAAAGDVGVLAQEERILGVTAAGDQRVDAVAPCAFIASMMWRVPWAIGLDRREVEQRE